VQGALLAEAYTLVGSEGAVGLPLARPGGTVVCLAHIVLNASEITGGRQYRDAPPVLITSRRE
jgi:hypothetical protein